MQAYQSDIETVLATVDVNPEQGLSHQEIVKRQQAHGYNTLKAVKQKTVISIFISQFQNPLVYILFFAAVIIFLFGEDKLDAFVISGVLFFNAILGTIQENRTKNIIENLKHYIKAESVVLRDGKKSIVEEKDLVVGDIIFLQEGQRVPADARMLSVNNMRVDEAILTGEAHAIQKQIDVIKHHVPLGDRTNMIFKGTYILTGSGIAVVIAIAADTELGKIHRMTEEIDTNIPLRDELEGLSHWILLFILITCLLLFGIGIATGKPIKELLVMLTALFICVVPEGLPVVLTLTLVNGALQMARRFILVRNMQAVEALGRTNVIVIDKTGTLTRNEMIVSRVWTPDGTWEISGQGYRCEGSLCKNNVIIKEFAQENAILDMAIAASLLNNAEIIHIPQLDIFEIKGDPTEAALAIFSQKLGDIITQQTERYTKIYEIPFNSVLRYHAGFYTTNTQCTAFIIGSPETVLARSSHIYPEINAALTNFLDNGLRVVAIGIKHLPLDAYTHLSTQQDYEKIIHDDIQFLGFAGIEDSIRTDVHDAIEKARSAGINVVMATGDHQVTALHVAQQVGIFQSGDDYIDASELDNITDNELMQRMGHVTVFSRVSAQHKMRIIQLLQRLGNIVAMTGDGINDAPSLAAADLGIAMGRSGTEVAKQASDLVLLNDSFVTIIDGVEQGRHIFYTLKRIILYFFSTNMGEILIVLFAMIADLCTASPLPLPITAVQILWLNLVTDGFLDVGLSMEPKESGLLDRRWLEQKHQLIDKRLILKMLFMAVPMGLGSLAIFLTYYQADLAHARTMTLVTMAMYQWFNAWNCRSEKRSLFELGLFSNLVLLVVMALVLALQSAIVYVPFMRHIFKTVPLSAHDWIIIIAVTAPIIILEEMRKVVGRKLTDHYKNSKVATENDHH